MNASPGASTTAPLNRAAIAFACDAERFQTSPSSSAISCADTNLIFDASCMFILRRNMSPSDTPGCSTTTLSPYISPFLVPPKLRMSTPASVVKSRNGSPREAAAFERRAPSMCSFMPSE